MKLQTLELHWAESYAGLPSEHNVIVVTAKGQPFAQGILLDNWRYGGNLVYGPVAADPNYRWTENKEAAARRLKKIDFSLGKRARKVSSESVGPVHDMNLHRA